MQDFFEKILIFSKLMLLFTVDLYKVYIFIYFAMSRGDRSNKLAVSDKGTLQIT